MVFLLGISQMIKVLVVLIIVLVHLIFQGKENSQWNTGRLLLNLDLRRCFTKQNRIKSELSIRYTNITNQSCN